MEPGCQSLLLPRFGKIGEVGLVGVNVEGLCDRRMSSRTDFTTRRIFFKILTSTLPVWYSKPQSSRSPESKELIFSFLGTGRID